MTDAPQAPVETLEYATTQAELSQVASVTVDTAHLRALLTDRKGQLERLTRMTETLVDTNDHRNQVVKDLTACAQATSSEYWRTVAAQHQSAALVTPPQASPHQVTVTHLSADFDLSDKKEHELLVADHATGGWTSHLVRHPPACNHLAYGEICWFDDLWENGPYAYEDIAPGVFHVLLRRDDVGDHEGEYSHTEDLIVYVRSGDAPEPSTPAVAESAGYSGKAPF